LPECGHVSEDRFGAASLRPPPGVGAQPDGALDGLGLRRRNEPVLGVAAAGGEGRGSAQCAGRAAGRL